MKTSTSSSDWSDLVPNAYISVPRIINNSNAETIDMLNRKLLFCLIFFPTYFLIAFLIGYPGIPVYLKVYFGGGCVIGAVLFFIKKARSVRSVSPINGSVDENYARLYREFSIAGFRLEEYEPVGGRQLIVFFNRPGRFIFITMGIILLLAGMFPGLIWFIAGRDKLSITLKEEYGYVYYIFKTNNKNYAGKIWFKIDMKRMKELLGPTPEGLETEVRMV